MKIQYIVTFLSLLLSCINKSADTQSRNFNILRKHFENCSILCTDPSCFQKSVSSQYKALFRQVYSTYHSLHELKHTDYQCLDSDYRFFINNYGQVLTCKKNALKKKDFILLKESDYHNTAYRSDEAEYLARLWDVLNIENKQFIPPQYIKARNCEDIFIYRFIDISQINRMDAHDELNKKQYTVLLCITNLTQILRSMDCVRKKKDNELMLAEEGIYYAIRYIFVSNPFTITSLYQDIDLHDNGGRRLVVQYANTESGSVSSTEISVLLTIRFQRETVGCREIDKHCVLFPKKFTLQRVLDNHIQLCKGKVGDFFSQDPLNCYCTQLIEGPSQEINDYLKSALQRITVSSTYLSENPLSTPVFKVYNNPFGQFVIYENSNPIIFKMKSSHLRSIIYHRVGNTADLYDNIKMLALANEHARKWTKTEDNNFLYYYESNQEIKPICSQSWPFGYEYSWGDRAYDLCQYNALYNRNEEYEKGFITDKDSFKKYRLWLLPLKGPYIAKSGIFDLNDKQISFCLLYTDWPYTIKTDNNSEKKLILEHQNSDYTLYIDISRRFQDGDIYATICFSGQQKEIDVNNKGLFINYVFKNQQQWNTIQEKKHTLEQQKLNKQKQDQLIAMGFLQEPDSTNQNNDSNRNIDRNTQALLPTENRIDNPIHVSTDNTNSHNWLLRLNLTRKRLFGGFCFSVVALGLFTYLKWGKKSHSITLAPINP